MHSHQQLTSPRAALSAWLRPGGIKRVTRLLEDHFQRSVVPLNAGRTGIYLSLAAYGLRRSDLVQVPPYLSQCVLNTITRTAFPDLHAAEGTKAVLVYHQFGFPQRLDRLLQQARSRAQLVIEDCAHCWGASYQGRKVGSWGDAAIFSFPKYLPTLLGGCLVTDDQRILDFAHDYLRRHRGFSAGVLSTFSLAVVAAQSWASNALTRGFLEKALEMLYAVFPAFPNPGSLPYGLFPKTESDLSKVLSNRARRWRTFRTFFREAIYDQLEVESEVVPFLIPVFGEPLQLASLVQALKQMGISTGVYHFDVERNMLASRYAACVPLPLHDGISDVLFEKICQAARDRLGAIQPELAQSLVTSRGK